MVDIGIQPLHSFFASYPFLFSVSSVASVTNTCHWIVSLLLPLAIFLEHKEVVQRMKNRCYP